MTGLPVEAVWFWRFTKAPFKATYGRLPGTTYSKDFLQAIGPCARSLDEVFQREQGQEVSLRFVWPGGSRNGKLFEAADYAENGRLDLRWETNNAPDPWKLFPDSSPDPLKTFPGNPDHKTQIDADREFEAFRDRNLDPWMIIVKLFDQTNVLHARAYLGRPPTGREGTSTELLPQALRASMAKVPAGGGCGVLRATSKPPNVRATAIVKRVLDALERGPNVLLVGPPGTGKTVALEDLRELFGTGAGNQLTFDADRLHAAWPSPPSMLTTTGPVRAVVFHPSYSYEEFVLGLVPKPADGGGIDVEPRPGPLLSLAHWASEPGNAALLIIDEFNRGNAAGIFGDTLALLDNDKRDDPAHGRKGATIDRAYAGMTVKVSAELETPSGGVNVPDRLRLPASLWIVSALNSSDRSVAPIDAALRRRFSILRVGPDYEVLASHYGIAMPVSLEALNDPSEWHVDDVFALALALLRGLNSRIELVVGADFLLGHGLVWDVSGVDVPELIQSLCAAFDEQIVSTLRMTFVDQDEPLGAILGAGPPPASGAASAPSDSIAYWILPPPQLDLVAPPRLRIRSASDLAWEHAARVLRALV